MKRRGRFGGRCWRAFAPILFGVALALPPVVLSTPLHAAAAVPAAGAASPHIATYAGAPAGGKPTEVAQQPFGVAVSGRYTYIADPANHVVRLLIDNSEVAFAGNGSLATEGDGADPAKAQLAGPYAVAVGNVSQVGYQVTGFDVYIADTFGHQIRKATVTIPPIDSPSGTQTAVITTIAGTGAFGFAGDGGLATGARLNSPYGIAWDKLRNTVYLSDTLNNRIRAIRSDGTITTVAGSGAAGYNPAEKNALKSALNHPRGLAVDDKGRVYIADTYNNVIRLLDPGSGTIRTVAGTGAAGYGDGMAATGAALRAPSGLALDAQGDIYIADTGNHVVRELGPDGAIHTVAGTAGKPGEFGDGGPAILAQLNSPMMVAVRPDGDVLIADSGNNLVRVLEGAVAAGPTRQIHVLAGNGTPSFAGDGKPPAQAQFASPGVILSKLSSDQPPNPDVPAVAGTRYVLDTFNNAVRAFQTADADPNDNHATADGDADDVSTVVGKAPPAPGPLTLGPVRSGNALAYPMGMALDAEGNRLYVADTFNNQIRVVDLRTNGTTTVAGTGSAGYSGDGGPAGKATFSYPTGVAVDSRGNLFIADTYNGVIREIAASGSSPINASSPISTVAGTGRLGFSGEGGPAATADLYFPYGVALDSANPRNLYITDSFNHRVRRITDVTNADPSKRLIQTVAGDGGQDFADGSAGAAHFDRPWSATVDQQSLYVADYLNHRVRKIDLASGAVSTMAGPGTSGLKGDVGPAVAGELDGPRGLSAIGSSGALLVADSFNNRLRWVGVTEAGIQRTEVNFDPTNLAGTSQPQSVTVQSKGSGLLVMGAVDLGANSNDFYLDPATNTCARVRLEPGTSCSFRVAFQPRAAGAHSGNVVIPDDATGGQQVVRLTGQATAPLVTLSPPTVLINQPANSAPTPQVVTLSNNGNGLLHINSIGLDQRTDRDFSQSNNCPSVMAPKSTCAITVTMSQIAQGDKRTRTGTLTVRDDAAGNTVADPTAGGTSQSVPLTGSLAQSGVSFAPQGLTFVQNVGTPSPPATLMLRNSGAAPLHLSGIRDDGDFVQTNNCPPALAPGASCALSVSFLPTTTGERDGYIVVADDSLDSPQKVPVTGIATMGMGNLGPDRLTFSQNVGETTAAQSAILTNTGDGPMTIQNVSTTGDYHASPRCPSLLLPHQSCTIGVTFTPQAPGIRKGELVVTDDANAAPGSQETVRLNGFGHQPVASLSATLLSPSANVGNAAGAQTVIVTNTGDGALTIRGIGIGGPAAGDYSQSSNCLRSLGIGASCSITVNFSPRAYGARNATLTLLDNGQGGSQAITLHGSGGAPHAILSNAFLNFGGRGVGSSSAPQNVVLFNSGTGTLSISGLSASGDFSMSSSCGSTLGSGASCMISVTFSPQGTGPRSGAVTITDNAGTQRITLSGVGT